MRVGSSGGVTTQGCWVSEGTCRDILAIACAGVSQLDDRACLRACWRVAVSNPLAGGACWGLCQAITTWYGTAACATQVDEVCDTVISDDC